MSLHEHWKVENISWFFRLCVVIGQLQSRDMGSFLASQSPFSSLLAVQVIPWTQLQQWVFLVLVALAVTSEEMAPLVGQFCSILESFLEAQSRAHTPRPPNDFVNVLFPILHPFLVQMFSHVCFLHSRLPTTEGVCISFLHNLNSRATFLRGKKEFKMSFAFPISIIFPELFTPTLS